MHKRGLGKGLGSLIPRKLEPAVLPEQSPVSLGLHDQVLQLETARITPNPHQPRQYFAADGLDELAQSIREHGIIQPLVVRQTESGYELIAGERRLRAAKIAGLTTVPAIVRDLAEQERLEVALLENVQRRDLNPVEEAMAYRRLMDEFNLTQDQLSQRVGKSRPVIANMLRILNLPDEIQKALIQGLISYSTARIIVGLPESEQMKFFYQVLKSDLTVSQVDDAAHKLAGRPAGRAHRDPHLLALEERISHALGTKVAIKKSGTGGRIAIQFYSAEELENLARRIAATD